MAVSERLETRLSKVPGVTSADIAMWVNESVTESGLSETEDENAVLHLALSIAYETIASDAARYFTYKDGDESIDKTNIFENYMKLAKESRRNYRKAKRGGGAFQTNPKRADNR